MQGDDIFGARAQFGNQPAPARPANAGGMRLVDQQHRALGPGEGGQFGQRREIAVHRIQRFDRDPRLPAAAAGAPGRQRPGKGAGIVVRHQPVFGAGQPQPLVGAGMDQLIRQDQVAALRQGRHQRRIGGEAG